MRASSRLLLLGFMFAGVAAGVFALPQIIDITPASGQPDNESLRRIGQVAGALAGASVALVVIALLLRSRGR